MSFKQLAQGFLLLSVAVLFNKTVTFLGGKLDVISLAVSTIFLAVALIKKEFIVDWRKIAPYGIAAALIIISTIIGSLMSLHIFSAIPFKQIMTEYRILFGCFLIFFEILILGRNDQKFLTWLTYAFLLSLIVVITPYVHIDALQRLIGAKQYRFFGLIGDANYYPTFMMLPIVLAFYFLTKQPFVKENALKIILLYLLFSLTVALTWWSGSRSGWLGVIVEMGIFIILVARNSKQTFLRAIALTAIFLSAIAVGYVILPTNATSDIRARLGYITTPEQQAAVSSSNSLSGPTAATVSNGDNSVKTIAIIDAVSYNQDRIHIWEQGLHFFKQNPLGYGLVYYNIVDIISADHHVSAHSFIVETLLIGGPLLVLTLGYLLWEVGRAFFVYKKIHKEVDIESIVFAALIGFLVCSLFLSSLLLRWFWVELAMIIAWQMNRGYSHPFTLRKKAIPDNHSQILEK